MAGRCALGRDLRHGVRAVAAFLLIGTMLVAGLAHAEVRMALVIGNSNYAHGGKLTNPANDAVLISKALQRIGFTVVTKTDLDNVGLNGALRDFARDTAGADVALVYYAGHGMEVAGTNYLIPVDAALTTDSDIEFEGVPVDRVLTAVGRARRMKVIILDACRNNPFADTMRRTVLERGALGVGLARPTAGNGMLIAYAAREGTTSADGAGSDSPYAVALARHLQEVGVDVRLMFGKVHDDVIATTAGRQEPSAYDSLGGEGYELTTGSGAPQAVTEAENQDTPPAAPAETSRSTALTAAHARHPVPATAPVPTPPPAQALGDCAEACPEMVAIPAGQFVMGSPIAEAGRDANEGPAHRVVIGYNFSVSKYPITKAQFAKFAAATQYRSDDPNACSWDNPGFVQTDQDPAVCVNFADAGRYVDWLSKTTGHSYRLLSAAEYEYVNRAGSTTTYWWGNSVGAGHANCRRCGSAWDDKQTSPVGTFAPNPFGLFDTTGDVWSWVLDCYADSYLDVPDDGSANNGGICRQRVVRGGSWLNLPDSLRSARRNRSGVDVRYGNLGLRVARTD